MLVSHRKKFIYTKTAKTAGTSVESYFERYCMPEGEWSEQHSRDMHVSEAGIIGLRGPDRPPDTEWFHHMSARKIKEKVGIDVWNSYFKFCVIRDPFDKLVSAFYHFNKARRDKRGDEATSTLKQCVKHRRKPSPEFNLIAEEFEHYLTGDRIVVDRDKYIIDGELCVDEVIRYESLQDGLKSVCDKIGVGFDASRLPQFKKGTRDSKVGLCQIYTPKAIKIVSDVYAYELERFGYSAPEIG